MADPRMALDLGTCRDKDMQQPQMSWVYKRWNGSFHKKRVAIYFHLLEEEGEGWKERVL